VKPMWRSFSTGSSRYWAPPAHIQVRVEGELPVIFTASAQLEQVLRNLINNAIKHHDKPHGEVVLSGRQVGDFVEFVVRDDGPGILPQFHDKILRSDEDLKKSIVFIMTTSDGDEDKVKAYNLGVAGYILKSNPANAFLEATALLDTYWRVVEFTAA
jgi:hypothetical protein